MAKSKKGRIFINYRRADSEGYAGRIYDRIAPHFDKDSIFMDVDAIPPGMDFVDVLEEAVDSCDVLIVLLGRQWLNIKDERGNRRLDDPEDFVRIEIATVLKRDIRVIPILLGGTQMPTENELPDNLRELARRNAIDVSHNTFKADTHRLIKELKKALQFSEKKRREVARKKAADKKARQAALRKEFRQEKIESSKRFFLKNRKRFLLIAGGTALFFLFSYIISNIEYPVKPTPTENSFPLTSSATQITETFTPVSESVDAQTILFLENFDQDVEQSGNFIKWGVGQWDIVKENDNGVYQLTNLSDDIAGITFGSLGWQNYVFEFRLKVLEMPSLYSNIGVGFRQVSQNADRSYGFYFSPSGNATLGDEDAALDETKIVFQLGKWYFFQVKAQNNIITIYLDGSELMSVEDTTYPLYAGNVAIWGDPGSQFQVDDIKVVEIP